MPGKRKSRKSSLFPQTTEQVFPPPSPGRLAMGTVNTDPAKRTIATPTSSPKRQQQENPPSRPSIFPMDALATLSPGPVSPSTRDEDISPANGAPVTQTQSQPPSNPPAPPLPWLWRCHACHTIYRLSCTRRCLSCAHVLCDGGSGPGGGGGGVLPPSPKRRRRHSSSGGGPCRSEFDYAGWEAWGRWRRGGEVEETDDDTVTDDNEGFAEEEKKKKLGERERKREMFARGEHDCSVHCDFPSECHNAAYLAAKQRAEQMMAAEREMEVQRQMERERQMRLAPIPEEEEGDADEDKDGTGAGQVNFDDFVYAPPASPDHDVDDGETAGEDGAPELVSDFQDVYELYAADIEDDSASGPAPAAGDDAAEEQDLADLLRLRGAFMRGEL